MSQLTKDEMRKSLKKIRQSITGEKKKDYDLEITCRFLMTEEYNKADTVLCYAGTKDEIDTRYLIYAALANHKRVGLPRCNGDILDFYYVRGLDDLMVGSFGIMLENAVEFLILEIVSLLCRVWALVPMARESAMAEDIMIDLFPIIMGKLLVCATISK